MEAIWTAKARITYFQVMDYLEKNWTKKEVLQFYNRVEIIIRTIQKNPGIYPESQYIKDIRKAFVDKNNSLFYMVDHSNNRIFLLTFFDNRQNPKKLADI